VQDYGIRIGDVVTHRKRAWTVLEVANFGEGGLEVSIFENNPKCPMEPDGSRRPDRDVCRFYTGKDNRYPEGVYLKRRAPAEDDLVFMKDRADAYQLRLRLQDVGHIQLGIRSDLNDAVYPDGVKVAAGAVGKERAVPAPPVHYEPKIHVQISKAAVRTREWLEWRLFRTDPRVLAFCKERAEVGELSDPRFQRALTTAWQRNENGWAEEMRARAAKMLHDDRPTWCEVDQKE